jgi:hypothetical protein
MVFRHLAAWLLLLVAAIINGVIRQSLFIGRMSELHAHQLSTLSGIILFGVIIWGLHRMWPLASAAQAWIVGVVWLALTLAFEFLFFHYVGGKSWEALLNDYNILEGRLWPLLLLWVMIAPYVMHRVGRRSAV